MLKHLFAQRRAACGARISLHPHHLSKEIGQTMPPQSILTLSHSQTITTAIAWRQAIQAKSKRFVS
jgi:hypothetical protein